LKKSPRGSIDFSIATLSIRLKGNREALEDAKIALNGVSSKPILAKKTEGYLIGKSINGKTMNEAIRLLLKETTPLSGIGPPVFLKRKMIAAMFSDLMESMWD